jgi:hypothetical protein
MKLMETLQEINLGEIGETVQDKAGDALDAASGVVGNVTENFKRGGWAWYTFGVADALIAGFVIGYFVGRNRARRNQPALEI